MRLMSGFICHIVRLEHWQKEVIITSRKSSVWAQSRNISATIWNINMMQQLWTWVWVRLGNFSRHAMVPQPNVEKIVDENPFKTNTHPLISIPITGRYLSIKAIRVHRSSSDLSVQRKNQRMEYRRLLKLPRTATFLEIEWSLGIIFAVFALFGMLFGLSTNGYRVAMIATSDFVMPFALLHVLYKPLRADDCGVHQKFQNHWYRISPTQIERRKRLQVKSSDKWRFLVDMQFRASGTTDSDSTQSP